MNDKLISKKFIPILILIIISIAIIFNSFTLVLLIWKGIAFASKLTDLSKFDYGSLIGGIVGGIIGGLVAFFVAKLQISHQTQLDKQKEVESNRSYIISEYIIGRINLSDIITNSNSRLIETKEFSDFSKKHGASYNKLTFYKIQHYGNPEVILNCDIKICLMHVHSKEYYDINTFLGVIEKGVEIYVPLVKIPYDEINIMSFEMEFTTLRQERILYVHDNINHKISYFLIRKDEKREELFSYKNSETKWFYPAKFKDENFLIMQKTTILILNKLSEMEIALNDFISDRRRDYRIINLDLELGVSEQFIVTHLNIDIYIQNKTLINKIRSFQSELVIANKKISGLTNDPQLEARAIVDEIQKYRKELLYSAGLNITTT